MITTGARRILWSFVVLFVAFVVFVLIVVMPPAPRRVARSTDPDPLAVKGAIHVHTVRSDGGGSVDDVAAAASAAGLSFVILTDHADGRRIEPPSYRSGVLVIDGAEISTSQGHVLAIGSRAAEYPLAGEARDVIEDIHRLGGIAVVAHPASPKRELAWSAWDTYYDGLEWLNADSEWRDERPAALARLALGYWLRPAAAVARTFDRPDAALKRADLEAARRPIVLLAGHDAHARIGSGTEDQPGSGPSLPLPSYRSVFRSFAVRALLDAPLTRRAPDDAAIVLRAVRHGRVFTAIDGLAPAAGFTFTIRSGGATAGVGDRLIPAGPLQIEVAADAPDGARIVVLGNGREVASGPAPRLRAQVPPVGGAYRAEVRLDDAPGEPPVPWIVTSPISVGLPPPAFRRPAESGESVVSMLTGPEAADAWTVEHSSQSEGAVSVSRVDGTLEFTYALGSDGTLSPFAAASRRVDVSGANALEFRIRADRPGRVSVQLRSPSGSGDGKRWRRSIYVDADDRLVRIPLSEFVAVPPQKGGLETSTIDSLLFVVDTVNAEPGRRGTLALADARVLR